MKISSRTVLHPFGPIAAQAVGHGVNFLSQLLLLHSFGAEVYGELGLGLLVLSTLGFLGELGLPAFLLRLAATNTDWAPVWRVAVLRRLLILIPLISAAILGWGLWRGFDSSGLLLLIAATPGLLLSAANLAPILYGLEQPRRAALASHLRWAVYGAATLLIALKAPAASAGLFLGLAVSGGWLAQHLILRKGAGLPRDLRPRLGQLPQDLRQGALGLITLGILALLHGRALPFLLAGSAPHLLASCLLALQILQGLASLLAQSDRLLLPGMLKASGTSGQLAPLRGLVQVIVLATALLILGLSAWIWLLPGGIAEIGGWMILEWSLAQLGFAGYLGILAQHRETSMLNRQILFTLCCLGLQALAVAVPPPADLLLAGRAIAAAGLAAIAIFPLSDVPLSAFLRASFAAALLCLTAIFLPILFAIGLALLWAAWEARSLARRQATL